MIYIFRLSRITGTSHTFVIKKQIDFDRMELLGVQLDNPDKAHSTHTGTTSELPIYLSCDLLDNDAVVMDNGKGTSSTAGFTTLIPIGAIGTEINSLELNGTGITLIDEPTTFAPDTQITWALKELDHTGQVVSNLANDTAFGLDEDVSANVVSRGANIIVKFHLRKDAHIYSGNETIPNSV